MRNETSGENSKPVINNSSMATAENSSSLQSKLNNKKNRIKRVGNSKYSNRALFENRNRDHSNNVENRKNPNSIYITDVTLSKFRETDLDTKSTFEATHMTYKTQNHFIRNKNKNKSQRSILPHITNIYHKYITNPPCFTCCDKKLNPQYLTRLYNEQLFNEREFNKIGMNKTIKGKKTFRDGKYEFVRKTNEIKRFKYEMDIKKEAMEDYKQNIRAQINGIENTINDIKTYRDNLENNFLSKYNKELRILEKQILDEKLNSDKQIRELRNLKKELSSLKLLLVKKGNVLKDLEKWICLQIYIKEGVEPKDLKTSLMKYNNKLIFDTPEELYNALKFRETKNLRLIEIYNKIEVEKESYRKEIREHKKEDKNTMSENIDNLLIQKENILNAIKKRGKSLKSNLNKLNIEKNKFQKDNITSKKRNRSSVNIHNINNLYKESDLKQNQLGILYKPIEEKIDIFNYIDSIFITIICNNVNGLKLNSSLLHQIDGNFNITKSQKAFVQMKIIEISLNYLTASIHKKISTDKKSLLIKEKICKVIDLYHKRINGEKNKMGQIKYRERLMKKIEEKNSKTYYLPKGKIEKYNILNNKKKKDEENKKNKKVKKKIDIFDFLYDISNDENENEGK